MPDDFDDLTEEEQQRSIEQLEGEVRSAHPAVLRDEIGRLARLIDHAKGLEGRDVQSKLLKLRSVLTEHGLFSDPKMRLLVFTEHKDTRDYVAGDGRDNRPLGKLREWGLTLTQIHGGMKIGDRDMPGSRIHAEREFKESAQVLVATEAAGEGINLQFCWLMINYDIPWRPVRLEQRVGRTHRYGQEHDCLVINFVAQNTREGRVLQKLLDRLGEIGRELVTDQVFDVVGEVFPSTLLEKLFRDRYARLTDEHRIQDRIVKDVSPDRFRAITESALEGLAKKELNLSAIVGKSAEAKERRLVPEGIEQFFVAAAPESGLRPKLTTPTSHVYRVVNVPRNLIPIGDQQEAKFGRLGREYGKIAFEKAIIPTDPTRVRRTPGHPLFEAVRTDVLVRVDDHLGRGAIFFDLPRERPAVLDVFAASIKDGRGNTLHPRLFVVENSAVREMSLPEPTIPQVITPA